MTRISALYALGGAVALLAVAALPSIANAIEIKTPTVKTPDVKVPQVNTPQANTHTNTLQPELLKGSMEGQTVHNGTDFHGKGHQQSPRPTGGSVAKNAQGSLNDERGLFGGGPPPRNAILFENPLTFNKDIIALPPAPSLVVRVHPELPSPPGWLVSLKEPAVVSQGIQLPPPPSLAVTNTRVTLPATDPNVSTPPPLPPPGSAAAAAESGPPVCTNCNRINLPAPSNP